jgi:aryl-alcohol dehydrogenase-like predicted oxidoreductase
LRALRVRATVPVMTSRRLGRSELLVSPVGLGCWQFGGSGEKLGRRWSAVPQQTVDAIVRAALVGGVNWFDTAEIYGRGASERALAHALCACGKAPGEVLIASKWWPTWRTARNLRRTIQERLDHLSPYPIDLYQVHVPTSLSSIGAQMAAMADLVQTGRIRAVGVSNFSASQMRAAHAALAARGLPLCCNQVRYSLVDRRVERDGVLAAARELGVSVMAYSPLGQGVLTGQAADSGGPLTPLRRELAAIAGASGATSAQVALAWLLHAHGDGVVVIPGATRAAQIVDNVGALALTLDPGAQARLEELSRPFL